MIFILFYCYFKTKVKKSKAADERLKKVQPKTSKQNHLCRRPHQKMTIFQQVYCKIEAKLLNIVDEDINALEEEIQH